MDDNIVAALAVSCIFGLPILGWIVSRVLAHQERMEMLRRGFIPPPNARDLHRAMKQGWGPAPVAGQYPYQGDYYAQRQLRKGIQVAFVGFALLIGLGFIGYHGDGRYVYGPWLLGGLIPMFVGIAQIVSAVLSGATIASPNAGAAFQPGPAPGPAAAPSSAPGQTMPPGPTYGGWRPGAMPEIEKPASPPDYRS